jgi:small subunit ribosomal protein S15
VILLAKKKEEPKEGREAKREKTSDKKAAAEGIISPGFLPKGKKAAKEKEEEKQKAAEKKTRQHKPRVTELEHKLAEAQEKLRQKKEKEAKEEGKAAEKAAAEKPLHAKEGLPERLHRERKPGVPAWVELHPAEAVEAMINLANAGHSSSEIGMLLRDQYGVPNIKALCGKSIEEILAEHKLLPEIPADLMNLIKRSVNLRKHLAKNKKDFTAKRGLQLSVAKIRNLVTYYKRKGRLPMDWHYSEETAALLVK